LLLLVLGLLLLLVLPTVLLLSTRLILLLPWLPLLLLSSRGASRLPLATAAGVASLLPGVGLPAGLLLIVGPLHARRRRLLGVLLGHERLLLLVGARCPDAVAVVLVPLLHPRRPRLLLLGCRLAVVELERVELAANSMLEKLG